MLPKEDREIISKIGRYQYNKMKELGMTLEEYREYQKKVKEDRKFKKQIGYRKYEELKQLGMTLEEYKRFKEETKYKNKKKYEEKNKIRYRTIRYIERYCNLEMKCQVCGQEAEIHHPNYNDYLKINLLCKKHHTQLHNFELVPPEIIDLEKIAIKKPPQQEKEQYIQSQIENIKIDILDNNFSYPELKEKYALNSQTIKRHLFEQSNYKELEKKLKENGKLQQIVKHNRNPKNPLQQYKQKYSLSSQGISRLTGIPLPTIRAIECGKTKIENIRSVTKRKLLKLTTTDIKERR